MSNRTILEINHDYTHVIKADPEAFVAAILEGLRAGYPQAWEDAKRFGVTRYVMAHHSDERRIAVNGVEYPAA